MHSSGNDYSEDGNIPKISSDHYDMEVSRMQNIYAEVFDKFFSLKLLLREDFHTVMLTEAHNLK